MKKIKKSVSRLRERERERERMSGKEESHSKGKVPMLFCKSLLSLVLRMVDEFLHKSMNKFIHHLVKDVSI